MTIVTFFRQKDRHKKEVCSSPEKSSSIQNWRILSSELADNMENLYTILGSSSDAQQEDLKHAYQKLALKYHPDKQSNQPGNAEQSVTQNTTTMFMKVKKAWDILSDPTSRKEYDARWKQHCMAQDWPVQDEVDIKEFDHYEDSECFVYECRCGGEYVLSETDVKFKMDYVSCGFCSLCIKVKYTEDSD